MFKFNHYNFFLNLMLKIDFNKKFNELSLKINLYNIYMIIFFITKNIDI
jgi:hypothetical protein